MQTSPLVSVLLPTIQPWPAVSDALQSLLAQETSSPYEILLLAGTDDAIPPATLPSFVRSLSFPGLDTFALRAAGLAESRGSIIAITEDHCLASPGWIDAIVRAHREHNAMVLVGATENHAHSAARPIDRANFILTFVGQNDKRLTIDDHRLPVPTNLSMKRSALTPTAPRSGDFEYRLLAELRQKGELRAEPSIVVQHRQCWGRAAPAVHFASGRSYGGFVHQQPWRVTLLWLLQLPLLPFILGRRVAPDVARGAGGAPPSFADVLCVATLIAANICGQLIGCMFGAGRSRSRL